MKKTYSILLCLLSIIPSVNAQTFFDSSTQISHLISFSHEGFDDWGSDLALEQITFIGKVNDTVFYAYESIFREPMRRSNYCGDSTFLILKEFDNKLVVSGEYHLLGTSIDTVINLHNYLISDFKF